MTSLLSHAIYRCFCAVGNALFNYASYKEGVSYELIGKENIPKKGKAAILYMNHTKPVDNRLFGVSFKFDSVDHFLVGFRIPRDIHFGTWNKFFTGLIGLYSRVIEQIPLSKSPKIYKKSKIMAKQFLSKGELVGIFWNHATSDNNKKSRLAAKLALENNVDFINVELKVIGRDGKEPESLVCSNTKAIQIIYHPAIKIPEFRKKYPGKSNRELEKLLTEGVYEN